MNHPDAFDLLESREFLEIGARVELRSNGRAFLVIETDTDTGEVLHARGCPFEAGAREHLALVVRSYEAMEGAA